MSDEVLCIEEVLKSEGVYVGAPCGVSMYPMLRNLKDTIIIRPVEGRLKKYDVPLYRRKEKYILHRIVKVLPDGYVICGDNCANKEYDINDEKIIGVLTGFYRGDKQISMDSPVYKAYSRIWVFFYPIRKVYKKLRGILVRIVKRCLRICTSRSK